MYLVKVKNRLDATKYVVFLLPQHVSGTNMPIIRSTISEYLPLLGGNTWNTAWVVLHWASWGEHCSEDVARSNFSQSEIDRAKSVRMSQPVPAPMD
jgi:hypothetical protein